MVREPRAYSGSKTEPYLKSHHADGGWELFADASGIGIRGFGKSRDLAFAETAYALIAALTGVPTEETPETLDIVCEAPSDKLLLRNWLTAVTGEMSARRQVFGRFAVNSHGHGLTAKAWGRGADAAQIAEIRAIGPTSFGKAEVFRDSEGNWIAQCAVDLPAPSD